MWRLFKYLIIPLYLFVSFHSVKAQEAQKGSNLRFRAYETNGELGKYNEGKTIGILETKGKGGMISYGFFGIGSSTLNTTLLVGDYSHTLISEWNELAFIFEITNTTTLTFGTGETSKGEGKVIYNNYEYTSSKILGKSWFAILGLEYTLPVTLDIIPFNYIELLLGYRDNKIKYSDYKRGGSTLNNNVKVQTNQYLFGFGVVF